MIDVQIIPATEEHLQMILPDVRQADIDELYAVSLMTTEDALRVGLRTATMAWSGICERRTGNHVWRISGVNDRWQWYATGWSEPAVLKKYQKTFLRHCRPVLQQMLAVYPRTENYVDERNHVAKAWLHWLGFRLEEAAPYGALGLNFHRFHMERK